MIVFESHMQFDFRSYANLNGKKREDEDNRGEMRT